MPKLIVALFTAIIVSSLPACASAPSSETLATEEQPDFSEAKSDEVYEFTSENPIKLGEESFPNMDS